MQYFTCAALTLVIASSMVACVQSDPADVLDPADEPGLQTRDNPTSGGHNGLPPPVFFEHEKLLVQAMRTPLLEPGTPYVSSKIGNSLLWDAGGREVFYYAAACAVPPKRSVEWQGVLYDGLGHLANGKRWLDESLSDPEIQDVLACVVAHLNHKVGVPILLSGPTILDDGEDHTEFWVEEARWTARLQSDDTAVYTAWPNPLFVPPPCVASGDPMDALRDRFCGQNLQKCKLEQGDEKNCKKVVDGWNCGDQPAIMTSLLNEDIPYMYCQ